MSDAARSAWRSVARVELRRAPPGHPIAGAALSPIDDSSGRAWSARAAVPLTDAPPPVWAGDPIRALAWRALVGVALMLGFASFAFAAGVSADWHTTDGGGGVSNGGGYSVSGTIGQADAGSAQTPTQLRADNGYWAGVEAPAPGGNGVFADSFE